MIARVHVTIKRDVLDPQGEAVAGALRSLGYAEVAGVRVGKLIEIDLGATPPEDARERVDQMCRKLLANLVIEDYRFEID
ncbi:MAG: phosphoribosylformylglycinamidine synthase subunit PurS [Deltaproteobacteria bacterium]|nr:phosphoribosylformylglycinamidine synthase subunit PurS [Deltaproteobacteria bacterium]